MEWMKCINHLPLWGFKKTLISSVSAPDHTLSKIKHFDPGLHPLTFPSCFQVQPGSLESESGIYASCFDQSGSRFITCEADKTIKMWKEDERATPESAPGLPFRPPKDIRRF